MAATIESAVPTTRRSSARAVAVVSTAHFASHFYMLLLPPLFPLLREVYGVGYTELGFAISVFSIVTACTQAPVGFVVDRLGARRILVAGLMLEAAAFALIGLIPSYVAFLALMAVAGLANSVYHPADYSLLNASVDPRRMGRAFSFHTAAGMLGNAVAPVTMVFLMTLTDWRTALVVCATGGALVGLLVAFNARALKEREDPATAAERAGAGAAATGVTGIRLLLTLPLLLGLLFFFGISVSQHGIQSFSVSALHAIHDAPLAEATTVLSCYLFASPVGVLAGGWVADRIRRRHDLFAATCFVAMAVCIGAVAALPRRSSPPGRCSRSPGSSPAWSLRRATCSSARWPHRARSRRSSASCRPGSTSAESRRRCCSASSSTAATPGSCSGSWRSSASPAC